jgi:phosphoribosylanthranilate isomerase
MQKIHTKICCIQSIEEALLAIKHGADMLGFVSEMPSGPGIVEEAVIAEIIAHLSGGVTACLLTSKTTVTDIFAQTERCTPDALQLCVKLSDTTMRELRSALPETKLIPVVHVSDSGAVNEALAAQEFADAILLDSSTHKDGVPQLGGTGLVHDWNVSREIVEKTSVPVYLAGGIKASNVREAIEKVQPNGVDLCTGVRTDWKLDAGKLEEFFTELKRI